MRTVIVTNIPTPYRNPVYSILGKMEGIELLVLFCSHTEPNRKWKSEPLDFKHKYLSTNTNVFVHSNWNVFKELTKFRPDVVITSGFNPTMLFSWFWTLLYRKKHIPFSDANIHSESKLSILHKVARKLVFKTSAAFIGASEKTFELYRHYGIPDEKLFKSCLAVDNDNFRPSKDVKKEYDLLFCGQFIKRKKPDFFVDISKLLSKKIKDFKVALVGDGELKNNCLTELNKHKVKYYDAGFVQPKDIAEIYKKSKIFIFPTERDPWGLVANEALACGVPVIVSSVAGVANELVIDNYNGYVIEEFNINEWAEKSYLLLIDDTKYNLMKENAIKSVSLYTFNYAAKGILNAAKYSVS